VRQQRLHLLQAAGGVAQRRLAFGRRRAGDGGGGSEVVVGREDDGLDVELAGTELGIGVVQREGVGGAGGGVDDEAGVAETGVEVAGGDVGEAAEGAGEAAGEAAAEAAAEVDTEAAVEAGAVAGEGAAVATSEIWVPVGIAVIVILAIAAIIFAFFAGYSEDASLDSADGAPLEVGTPENVQERGRGWTLKDNTDYSGIPCAEGSTDSGAYTHPIRGFVIRLCDTSLKKVASINSQNIVNMIKAAERDGINLRGGNSFRSYEAQIELRKKNCPNWQTSKASECNPDTAMPGNSMHERGLATDFLGASGSIISSRSDSVYIWLDKNAANFGYYNLPSEAWHFSTTGG